MRRFNHFAIGVAQGSTMLFSAFEDDGQMWTGQGPREERRRIEFDQPFKEPPVVHVGIGLWDTDGNTNQRLDILADQIGTEGFDIVFRTWGDTRIARIRAQWLAIGAHAHEDDFDV